MQKSFLIFSLLYSLFLFAGKEENEAKIRIIDAGPDQSEAIQENISELFPEGASQVQIAEISDDEIVTSHHQQMPPLKKIAEAVTDTNVGGHFSNEASHEVNAPAVSVSDQKKRGRLSWRTKLIIGRVVVNGALAAAMVALKNHVRHEDYDYARMATNFLVHGSVNGFFQTYGKYVAGFAYASWNKIRSLPNFEMSLKDLLWVNLTRAWPKRVLLTIGSVLIYRLTDYCYTGVFDVSLIPILYIAANIAASLAPSAIGLEMGANIGPKEAKGLPARNTHSFDLQNFTISVLFAFALAANTKEMNETFGVTNVWLPVYAGVAIGGAAWWATNSRWTNPELVPSWTLAKTAFKKVKTTCAYLLGRGKG